MARIAGVNIPDRKRVDIGLTYIYGIGRTRAGKILEQANVEAAVKVGELSEEQGTAIRQIIQDQQALAGLGDDQAAARALFLENVKERIESTRDSSPGG